jgi:hypothetical protein
VALMRPNGRNMGGKFARVCRKTKTQTNTNNGEKTMSHFYGVISQSARKTMPTARAHKTTGLVTRAQSWSGEIVTVLYYDEKTKKDMFKVQRMPHGYGCTPEDIVTLAQGCIDLSDRVDEVAFRNKRLAERLEKNGGYSKAGH